MVYAAIGGVIVGFAWGLALTVGVGSGIKYGVFIGALFGFLLAIIQGGIINRGNLEYREVMFVSGSIIASVTGVGVIAAIITGIVRLIFY
ncbi:MAG: hypothetical protein EAS52_15145 [Parapedobacter sp.]|nr:MAG: hypothetical protein EAS52_15145 [Parapedobacter sp.]